MSEKERERERGRESLSDNVVTDLVFPFSGIRAVQKILRDIPQDTEERPLNASALSDRLQECTVELLRQYVGAQAMR